MLTSWEEGLLNPRQNPSHRHNGFIVVKGRGGHALIRRRLSCFSENGQYRG
jgi:hypothetical protein